MNDLILEANKYISKREMVKYIQQGSHRGKGVFESLPLKNITSRDKTLEEVCNMFHLFQH